MRLCELLRPARPRRGAVRAGPGGAGGGTRRDLRVAAARGLARPLRRRGRVRQPGRDARGGRRGPRHGSARPRGHARRAHGTLARGGAAVSAAAVLAALAVAAPPAGHSVQGRPIPVVEVAGAHARTAVLVVGCIHGNETAGIAVATARERAPPRELDLWIVPTSTPTASTSTATSLALAALAGCSTRGRTALRAREPHCLPADRTASSGSRSGSTNTATSSTSRAGTWHSSAVSPGSQVSRSAPCRATAAAPLRGRATASPGRRRSWSNCCRSCSPACVQRTVRAILAVAAAAAAAK